jgi:hypothetical protein
MEKEDAAIAFIAVVCNEILRAGHYQFTPDEFESFYREVVRAFSG